MSGSFQSYNYVPGVSGYKLHRNGTFEFNSAKIQVGSLPSAPQLITITADSWSEYDLPANALERHAFIGAELEKIPAESRQSAEFTTEDISFDRDGSDVRTTLTYRRPETAEEVEARQNKAKTGGTSIKLVDGVMTVTHDGVVRYQIADLPEFEKPEPFIVVDGVSYISEAEVERRSMTKARISDNLSVKMELCNGRYVVAGTGIGFAYSDASASAETYLTTRITSLGTHIASQGQAITALNNPYASKINETELGKDLASEINKFPDLVRETIRKELRPGGLLYRSR